MSLKLKPKTAGGDYEQPEAGNQAAVLVAIIDLGTVGREYQGKPYDATEVYFVWELTAQQMTGSTHNHVIGKSYTASLGNKANLRKMIEKWGGKSLPDGDDFDLETLLGKICLLDVQQDGKYTKLDSLCASKLPKGMECPPAKRKPVAWTIENNEHLPEHLDWLPFIYGESVQDRIKRSQEWQEKGAATNGKAADEAPVDELAGPEDFPF